MQQTVAILGAGVAGMSAAHELAERGFQVRVYERNSVLGGKARSIPVPDSGIDYLKPHFDAFPQDRAFVRELLRTGRLELVGGTYNEPNTNLTGAEVTIR